MVSKENDRALHQIMAHINHGGCYAEWLQNVQQPDVLGGVVVDNERQYWMEMLRAKRL